MQPPLESMDCSKLSASPIIVKRSDAPVPLLVGQNNSGERMRSVSKEVVVLGLVARNNIIDFLANLNHGITKSA